MKHISKTSKTGFNNMGKAFRHCMSSTALTATGLIMLAAPVLADDNMWSQHVYTEGTAIVDLSVPDTTNIKLLTNSVTARGDGDIKAGYTVNIDGKRYVLFDTESDPTYILGSLNSNGDVFIFDQNGVVFGKDSVVNVGSIIASTADGFVETKDNDSSKLIFNNVGSGGKIELNGSINVSDAGIAAFVAPSVKNSGVINAKMGNVVLASGNAVTLDLYGDGLVEVAVNGALENALINNSGSISAEGGTVSITAAAAKDVVENVINMDGVVDVSSVSVRGGKIILSGGKSGTVKVSGKLDASGKNGGGSIDINGANINVADTGEFKADAIGNGNGGTIDIIAQNQTDFRGTILARGGELGGNGGNAEVSGYGILGFSGYTDLSANNGTFGNLLLDPTFAVIHSGIVNNPLGFNYIISAQSLANSMRTANVTVQADEFIDVGTKNEAYNTGSNLVDLALNTLIGTGNIDLSTWVGLIPRFPFIGSGTTAGSITFDTATLNINKDLKLGNGNVIVDANTVNLNALITNKNNVLLGDSRISSNAGIVNVLSNNAKIQQGIWLSNDLGDGVINVGSGTYNESINVDRDVILNGANAGVNPNTGVRVTETIIDPNSPGFYVTADGVTIDGFTITSADDGVLVENANNVTIKNNIIHDVLESGIEFINSSNGSIISNRIDNTGDSAVLIKGGSNFTVDNNYIGQNDGSTIEGNGILVENVTGGTVKRNRISNATQVMATDRASGIYLDNSRDIMIGGTRNNDGNIIKNSDWDGIKIKSGSGNTAQNNNIDESTRVGIYTEASNNLNILDNTINDSNVFGGVGVLGGENINIRRNTITEDATSTAGNGIVMTLVTGGVNNIINNVIHAINGFGINVNNSNNVVIARNDVYDTKNDGITVRDVTGNIAVRNNMVGKADGSSFIEGDGISLYRIDGANVVGNEVYYTKTTSFVPANGSGILLKDSSSINVGKVGSGNLIRNANWDGVKVDGGSNNSVVGNNIADSTRVGVYGVSTNDLIVSNNTIRNSNVTAGVGVYYSRNVEIDNNDIAYSYDDGIHVEETNGNIRITNNIIDESADDGIEVINSFAYTYIAGNTITNSGVGVSGEIEYNSKDYSYGNDGIHVRNVFKNNEIRANVRKGDIGNGEYNIIVYNNNVSDSADDGIQVLGSNSRYNGNYPVLLVATEGQEYGESQYEDIPYFFNETGRVLIQENTITNSGYGFQYGSNQDGSGADGIHVAGIYNDEYGISGASEGGIFSGYAVDILSNTVSNSGDDGIEVTDSSSVLIDNNTITNSGFFSYIENDDENKFEKVLGYESDLNEFGDYSWGADGIHVRNVSNNNFRQPIRFLFTDNNEGGEINGDVFAPYSVVVRNNSVTNSKDDGIEVLGSPIVLIDSNIVNMSGDDGINVLGFARFYGEIDYEGEGYESDENQSLALLDTALFDWSYFLAKIQNNTVTTSGNDGIESSGFNSLSVLSNNVTDSLANGLYISGFNNDYANVSNNVFTNFDTGANFESGVIDLTGTGNTFNGGRVGMRFAPFNNGKSSFAPLSLVDDDGGPNSPSFPVVPPTNYGGTIGAQIFNGQSEYYIELDNEAFFAPGTPTWLNGLNSIYDGVLPSSFAGSILPQAQYDAIEAKIFHFIDRNNLGLFFFGTREDDVNINQNLIFNRFGAFNGDVSGLNVRIVGLPSIPGGGTPVQDFNNINTFAGGTPSSAAELNNIETQAGDNTGNQSLNDIETAAGGESERCWSNAINAAGSGQVVNVVFGGTIEDTLAQAEACGGGI